MANLISSMALATIKISRASEWRCRRFGITQLAGFATEWKRNRLIDDDLRAPEMLHDRKVHMKTKAKSTKAGRKILAALKADLDAHSRGVIRTMRTVEMPDEPGIYRPADVAALRNRLEVSQAVFARILGVSTVLISHVEECRREPNPMMRRMFDFMSADPAPWAALARPRSEERPIARRAAV
jgi:DNA-binding transcriptional regulator YiaG